jgi:dTDP-4-amino-4,6-dideoxygalactose transaminase
VTRYRIPFNKPSFAGDERRYIDEAIERGHISGDGWFTKRCQMMLEQTLGVPKSFLTTSCTHALEMCALLLDIEPGDEVVVPSFAFVTTVNAFVLRGARPVFADIRPDTLNIDETRLAQHIGPRTRAVVALHYAGVACEMEPIVDLCTERGVALVEDNAHGLFGRYRDRPLGTFGQLATQSFHETKNFTCGEGGALLVNDTKLVERAVILRVKGTDRSRFLRGRVDKYTWVDLGSSYLPSDLLAAFLYAQLQARERIQARRRAIWERYDDALAAWTEQNGVRRPSVPEHCEQAWHMYYLLLPSEEARLGLIDHLEQREILAVFHYLPLNVSAMGRKLGGKPGDCPVTESTSPRLLRLPFYNALTEGEQDEVIEAITSFTC